MSKYIVFYRKNNYTNKIEECIGGDSILKPDQRYSIESLINKVLNKEICKPNDSIGFAIGYGINVYKINKTTPIIFF